MMIGVKSVASVCLSLLLVLSSGVAVYSQPSASSNNDGKESVQFWAPAVMLEGHEYYVSVIMLDYSSEETTFNIISNNENIVGIIDREIKIEPFKSHGVAKVSAKSIGEADLFAVSGEKLLKASVRVLEPALKPSKLDIILPSNRVSVKQVPAYVFIFDSFGNPLKAPEDIEVNISTFGNVNTQVRKVTIDQGTHYTKFMMNVEGNGGVTVAANDLESDMETIEFGNVYDEIELKVKIAPDILATSSSGELYVWLEKDGRPYVPDRDVKVVVSSEDARHLAFSKAVQFTAPLDRDLVSTKEIIIRAGTSFAKVMVWTTDLLVKEKQDPASSKSKEQSIEDSDDIREVTVTAVSDGLGSSSATVEIRIPVKHEPNVAMVFALPELVYDKLEIIVALYFSKQVEDEEERRDNITDQRRNITNEDDDDDLDEEDNEFIINDLRPISLGDSIMVHVSSDSLIKPAVDSVRMGKDDLDYRDHYTVIPAEATGKLGKVKITGAVGGARSNETEIIVEQVYSPIPTIAVIPLPTLANSEQDMFIVYALEEGTLTGSEIKNLIINSRPAVKLEDITDIGKMKIAKARSPDLMSGRDIQVTAIASGYKPGQSLVSIWNNDQRHIVAYHPSTVHVSEPFPVVFYAVNEKKDPISVVRPLVSSTDGLVKVSDGMYMLSSASEHNFVYYADGMNPGTSKVDVFSHNIRLEASLNGSKFKIGDDIVLTYRVEPANADVSLQTELPSRKVSDSGGNEKYIIETTIPSPHTIVLAANAEGFSSTSKEFKIEIMSDGISQGGLIEEDGIPIDLDVGFSSGLQSNAIGLISLIGIVMAAGGAGYYLVSKRKVKGSQAKTESDLTFATGFLIFYNN